MSEAKAFELSDELAQAFIDGAERIIGNSDDIGLGDKDDPVCDGTRAGKVSNMVGVNHEDGEVFGCWVRGWLYVRTEDLSDEQRRQFAKEIGVEFEE